MSSFTTHAVHVLSVTRATAANLISVVSHNTSNRVGTASILLTMATSRAISSALSRAIGGFRCEVWSNRVSLPPSAGWVGSGHQRTFNLARVETHLWSPRESCQDMTGFYSKVVNHHRRVARGPLSKASIRGRM